MTAVTGNAGDPAEGPSTVHLTGNLLTFRARGADTGGSFSLVECLTAPGQGSPPHRQQDEEAFFVLDGEFAISVDDETRRCGAGGFVHVAPGQAHGFVNVGEAPARMLILNMPAGLHEGFFEMAGDPVPSGTTEFPPVGEPDFARLFAAAERFHMELLPPRGVTAGTI